MSPDTTPPCSTAPREAGSSGVGNCGLIVTGASGWIGRAVVRHARSEGRLVVGACRQASDNPGMVRFDLSESESAITSRLEGVMKTASSWAVIHCAGLAHVGIEDRESQAALHRINIDGTARMTKVCSSLGVRRFVQVSTIAVYDWRHEQPRTPRDETELAAPRTVYGATKLEGERVVEQSGLDYLIIRLGTVFGSGDRANFSRLASAIRRRRFVIPGRGDQRKSCINLDSAARTLVAGADVVEPLHRLVNVALPEAPTLARISQAIAAGCGVPAPPHVPESMLRVAAWCGDRAASLGLPAPLTSSDLSKLCAWTWVDASRAIKMFPALQDLTFEKAMWQAAQHYRGA